MSEGWYNGYDWNQRAKKLKGRRGHVQVDGIEPCALCGDPNRSAGERHSEDYSEPLLFEPPASYPICKPCHDRLHKRFKRPPAEWELFCRHVEAGGHGREFATLHTPASRKALCAAIDAGQPASLPQLRERPDGPAWWRDLTLDPEAMIAPWGRPRPIRARPDVTAYRAALTTVQPTERECAILTYHASAPHRTVTMRQVAREVFRNDHPSTANLAYGSLAKRIGQHLDWKPDARGDGSPFWMSVIAEGWWPPSTNGTPREFELVMIPVLTKMFGAERVDCIGGDHRADRAEA